MSAWRWEWWLVVVVSIWWFQFDADSQAEAEYCVFFGSACSYPVQHSRISKPNVSRLETWVLMIWNDSLGLRRLRSHLAMHDRDLSWFIGSPPAFDTWPQRHSDRLWPGYEQSGSGEAETIYIYIIKKQNFPENFSHSTSPLFIWGKNWVKTLKALNWLEISWNKKRSWNTSKISRGFQKVNGTLKPQRRQQLGRCSCACDQGPVGIIHPAPLRNCLAELTSVNIREFTLSIPTPGVYKHHTVHKRITPAGLWVSPTHRTLQKPKNKWFSGNVQIY